MIASPRPAESKVRINEYTVVVSVGAEDGISEGDEVMVPVDDENIVGKTTQVGQSESVVELRI